MVIDDVISAFSDHKWLSLEVRTSELVENRHHLLHAVLRPRERLCPGILQMMSSAINGPHNRNVFARVGRKQRLNLVQITHSESGSLNQRDCAMGVGVKPLGGTNAWHGYFLEQMR
jgi:hypothetical protein